MYLFFVFHAVFERNERSEAQGSQNTVFRSSECPYCTGVNFLRTSLYISLQMIKAPVLSDWSKIENRKRFENVISVTY
jgi:hypothetical protein